MGRDLPDSFSPYKEICECGHDKVTHFEKKHTCLGMHCDCKGYLTPGSKRVGEAKAPAPAAQQTGSDHDDDDGGPLTPRLPFTWP